jgi:hypothetical protein
LLRKAFNIFIVFTLLFSLSCKKKKNEPEPTPVTSYNSWDAYSMLQTMKHTSDNLGVLWHDSSSLAVFYDRPIKSSNSNYVSAGIVKLNDSVLYYNSGLYSGYHPINITAPVKWTVTGSGTITPFDYTITPSYPKYTGGNLLPDTCIKANGITVTVSGVSNNTQGVSLFLNGSSGMTNKFISGSGNGSVTFTAADLASFNVNSSINLQLMMSNYNTQAVNGVVHSFVSTISYQKVIWLK